MSSTASMPTASPAAQGVTDEKRVAQSNLFPWSESDGRRHQSEWNDARQKLHAAERDARQLTVQRDQLKISVTNWAAAVASRDEHLTQANTQIRRLADELNATIRRFNMLATNHNAVVKDLNELRARLSQTPGDSPTPPPQP